MVLTGVLGRHMDRSRQRKQCIFLLSLTGATGLSLLAWATDLGSELTPGSGTGTLVLTYFGYLLADVSHDLLLVPGRTLIADLSAHHASTYGLPTDVESANSVFTLFQILGRFVSLVLGSFALEEVPRTATCSLETRACSHLQALMKVCLVVVILCGLVAITFVAKEDTMAKEFVEIEIQSEFSERSSVEAQPLIGHSFNNPESLVNVLVRLIFANPIMLPLLVSQVYGWIG